ncbi:ATP-binding protein, partial [Anaerophaga thermohalophila]|uniref:ATP-binding protein n=1 Tax=Anaerophaga thermohalophila TaxID=177400 RepID=UPI00037712C8
FSYIILILICSFLSIILNDDDRSPDNYKNVISEYLKNIATTLGKGKLVFSAMFLYFLLTFYSINDIKVLSLMLFWWFIIVADPQKLVNKISIKKKYSDDAIGRIISVQSKKIFLVRLFQDSLNTKIFDIVRFKYTVQDDETIVCYGFVLESFLLNDQKWIKVLLCKEEHDDELKRSFEKNIVYRISNDENIQNIIERFVGVIVDGSEIRKINFECYNSHEISEGDLLEINVNDKTIYYQITQGVTKEEIVEKKNETGFVKGEAIQLGSWNNENYSFEKYGWVPDVNSIVLIADTSEIVPPAFEYPEYKLGNIPNTTLPVVLNLHDAISHHFAILGVTGSGKSFITFEILKELRTDTKIICVDFTSEYQEKLKELNPKSILHDADGVIKIERMIADKETASKSKNSKAVLDLKYKIQEKLNEYINEFIESEVKIGIFELPDLSNTSFILEFTQFFLENVFNIAKKGNAERICLVLEEAHTVVPETTFLGDFGDFGSSKAIVNKIGQIALQGRKYGVGLLVIAQRTANVSKTVLTQCNTILCFQAFDETSFTFIGNYLGKELVTTLPNLTKYHAIVTGKGVKSNIPMIVDLTREI